MSLRGRARDLAQEITELGPSRFVFRVGWELGRTTGLFALRDRWAHAAAPPVVRVPAAPTVDQGAPRLPFATPADVAEAMRSRLSAEQRAAVRAEAEAALHGRVRCFSAWTADFGHPIDWYRDPGTGGRWSHDAHWSRALRGGPAGADVKLCWEAARFPHAFSLVRAAAFEPAFAARAAEGLAAQIASFCDAAPAGRGVHWASGQEIVVRLCAWVFALAGLRHEPAMRRATPAVARALRAGALHLEAVLPYSRHAVYNNHLLADALGLLLAGHLLDEPESAGWRATGRAILDEEADRQFATDGGYIQNSHTYHRVAMQYYALAARLVLDRDGRVPAPWLGALARSVDFLHAQQAPADGRLPNFGANDGALPLPLACAAYADFRPALQAASLLARGERLYDAGPWDEEAAWLCGPAMLQAPLRPRPRASVSFVKSGYHVLREAGEQGDQGSFATFRCGSLHERFAQIDMLALDVWWRGENVLVDAGSYLYGVPAWNQHFWGTAAHNTVTVDGRDQMLHPRQFKNVYWTQARLIDVGAGAGPGWRSLAGEHSGFARHPGGCVHRRSVLLVGDAFWVVVDHVRGEGEHDVRLQWLGGPFAFTDEGAEGRLGLATPAGRFTASVFDETGRAAAGDVVAGREPPGPRGWLSRTYGEKVAVPSLAVSRRGATPLVFVSVLAPGAAPEVIARGARWRIAGETAAVSFTVRDGCFEGVAAEPRAG